MAAPIELFRSERLVFFTDAVVAIAMTLLILPLLESVQDAAAHGLDTAGYLRDHEGQLVAFALSFLIIAVFWRSHHRLFAHVEHTDKVLTRLNFGWMFTIVWLPVVTAMVGTMDTDPLQLALYIGTMLVTSLFSLGMLLWLRGQRQLLRAGAELAPSGAGPWVTVTALFAVALLLAVIVPGLHYWAMLVLLLNPVLDRFARLWHRR